MSDTERLNLIEHYGWNVQFIKEEGYTNLKGHFSRTLIKISGKYGEVVQETLRDAIDAALSSQAKWSMS
jgi:hypothetical protein